MRYRNFSAWVLVAACTNVPAFGQERSGSTHPSSESETRTWPTIEPSIGMWAFAATKEERIRGLAGESIDLATTTTRVRAMIHSVDEIAKSMGRIAEELPANVDAANPEKMRERFWWRSLPACVATMELLLVDEAWTAEHEDLARACSDYLRMTKHVPEFDLADPTTRVATLWSLADWFAEQAKDPARYGQMIFTMYLGPYTGTEAEPMADAVVHSTCSVNDAIELRLLETGVEGLRTLAAFRGKERLWARTLRFDDDRDAVADLRFGSRTAKSLGSYGFLVSMSFGENVEVYLDREGKFLFYFLSW